MHTVKQTLLILLLLSSAACSSLHPKSVTHEDEGPVVNTIVMLPVATVAQKSDNFSYAEAKNLETGSMIVTELLTEYFSDNDKMRFITEDQVDTFKLNLSDNQSKQALSLGRLLHSDAVMFWNITRYAERDGGDYSVESPASVAFDYRLLLTETGQTLCAGVFEETQSSLTDNILSFNRVFKRGLKWITARQLAKEGIISKLSTCRYLDSSQQKPAETKVSE